MTKLQSLFYSLICKIVIDLVMDSISSVIGVDSSYLSLFIDLIPIIIYVFSLGLVPFFLSLCFYVISLPTTFHFREHLATITDVSVGCLVLLYYFKITGYILCIYRVW